MAEAEAVRTPGQTSTRGDKFKRSDSSAEPSDC